MGASGAPPWGLFLQQEALAAWATENGRWIARQSIDLRSQSPGVEHKAPTICSYHKLRHRHSGRYHWVDFHMVVPARWDIEHGHRAASAIEYEIEQALGEGNATAHVEPCDEAACSTCEAHATNSKDEIRMTNQ